MSTLNSVVKGLNLKRKNVVARMRRVSISIVVYLIWEERNKRVFENACSLVDSFSKISSVIVYDLAFS